MKKYKIKFVIWLVVALFAVTACGKREQSDDESSSGQETEARISEEEKTQLLRRIDYALLGQGPYTERALRSYLIADADDDGVESYLSIAEEKQTAKLYLHLISERMVLHLGFAMQTVVQQEDRNSR